MSLHTWDGAVERAAADLEMRLDGYQGVDILAAQLGALGYQQLLHELAQSALTAAGMPEALELAWRYEELNK